MTTNLPRPGSVQIARHGHKQYRGGEPEATPRRE
jgi:hypothetical protein